MYYNSMKFRKFLRVTHRDAGFFFFAMTLIYALSGIGMNHMEIWDPKYKITTEEVQVEPLESGKESSDEEVMQLMQALDLEHKYKKHYFPNDHTLKIFIKGGNVVMDMPTGKGVVERVKRRPIFGEFTYLHYDPIKYWTWFSDFFAVGLIWLAFSGIFMIKGKYGITRRGLIWTLAGIAIPLIYIIILL
ncbi:MAG: peptidase [Bacteroidetes bacterium]|nr:MAG: peptidase [Bacteroidota bacterium]PIE87756.1 MAG: peptidase [Bacteroidota bacterium]